MVQGDENKIVPVLEHLKVQSNCEQLQDREMSSKELHMWIWPSEVTGIKK
jgi:hypothetical protein